MYVASLGSPQEGQQLDISISPGITAKNEFQPLKIVIDNGCGVETVIERQIIRGKLEFMNAIIMILAYKECRSEY